MEEKTDIVPVVSDTPVIADDSLLAVAEAAERRVEAMKRIKRAALAVTNANDWINQGGKPYLNVSGAEKIARLFGISWRIDEPTLEQEEGGHYSFTYKGYFRLGSAEIEVIGSRSSRDPFFSRSHNKDIPPSEIDKNNVKKSAYTNLLGNGITRLLGIRNMTWEDLASVGIDRENVGRVEYRKAEMSEEAQKQKQAIRRMILEMAEGSNKKAQEILLGLTSFTDKDGNLVKGKKTVDELSERAVPVTYGKVKTAYEKWLTEKAKGSGGKQQEEVNDDYDQGGVVGGTDVTGQRTIE